MIKTSCKVIAGIVGSLTLILWGFRAGKSAAKDEIALETLRCENEKLKEQLNSKGEES